MLCGGCGSVLLGLWEGVGKQIITNLLRLQCYAITVYPGHVQKNILFACYFERRVTACFCM